MYTFILDTLFINQALLSSGLTMYVYRVVKETFTPRKKFHASQTMISLGIEGRNVTIPNHQATVLHTNVVMSVLK